MMKKLRKEQRHKILPAAIALSLGVITPFAPPQYTFAAETLSSNAVQYYDNNAANNKVGGQDSFINFSDSSIVQNNIVNAYKTIGLSPTGSNKVVTSSNVKASLSQRSWNSILYSTLMKASSVPEGANAFAIKIRDADSGAYYYKVLGAGSTSKDCLAITGTQLMNFLNENTGMTTVAAQEELYGYIETKDDAKIQEWMTKYLPSMCYIQLSDAELAEVKDAINKTNASNVLDYMNDSSLNFASPDIIESVQTSFKLGTGDSFSGGSKSYTYNKKSVAAGERWTPLDRAVTISSTLNGDYSPGDANWVTEDGKTAIGASDSSVNTYLANSAQLNNNYTSDSLKPIGNLPTTVISVGELTTESGSVIDLSYLNTNSIDGQAPYVLQGADSGGNANTINVEYISDTSQGTIATNKVKINRSLFVNDAKLADNTAFRLGVYQNYEPLIGGSGGVPVRDNDNVYLTDAAKNNGSDDAKNNLYIQLGYVPEASGTSLFGEWKNPNEVKNQLGNIIVPNALIGIYNGADNFEVTGQTSLADGIFSVYEITPEVGKYENYFKTADSKAITDDKGNIIGYDNLQGTVWYLKGYTYASTGEMAESGKSVSENSTVQNNFVKANNLSLFRRFDSLHVSNLNRPETGGRGPGDTDSALAGELRENLWADVWHGKFDAKAAYTRNTNQSYNGFQVGYDKLLSKKFYGGKIYTGFYASKIDGKSTTFAGSGEQDSYGLGVYSSWVGDKGHFIDLGVNAFKLKNDYHFTGNTGNGSIGKVKGENSTWAYGIGAQYGKRNQLAANWFWEPSVSLYVGHVDESNYSLSNGLGVHEQGYDTAIGKLGLKAGKNIGEKGNVYAGVSWGHEFAGGQKLHQSYGTQSRLIETVGGNDSWWEWNIGGKVKVSSNGTFNLDFVKTTGSDVGNEWSINGGLNFSWGGFESGGSKAAKVNASGGEPSVSGGFAKANAPTVVVGQASKVGNVQLPQMQQSQQSVTVESGSADSQNVYDMGEANSRVVSDDTGSVSGTVTGGMGEFELGGLTVEAKRPDWEKNLSPGQVSVIYPAQFEGEQKNLPELLDRVPGLFVQRLNGVGHYTVARVRGSTAAQVSVFVDGVQMNLAGDAAVNLSAIPADNIERIEVYRGYVPARFSGAPLGGVINIITKKPNEGHGHITQGIKSYGGYSSTYEYSMPLGSGSLLATYARDIWQGDFDYIWPHSSNTQNNVLAGTYKRQSNGYQNNNAMLKWQDDHWTVKGVWKKMHEGLARAVNRTYVIPYLNSGYFDADMDIDYKEFLIGRRDTFGNLDLGWHIAYLDSKKTYTNIGGYRQIEDTKNGIITGSPFAKRDEDDYLPGELWGTWRSKKWNGNLNAAMKLGSNHLLEFNADYTRETMDANGNRWDLTQEQIDSQTGVNRTVRKMLSKYNNREYHLTLQDTITLNDDGDFKLTPILRADKVEMEGLGDLGDADSRWMYSGGVALQKQLNDHWSFKSTWGTYNRHPNFYEIFGDGGFVGQNYVFTVASKGGNIDNGLWETGSQFDFSLNWQGKLAGADTDTILTWYQRKANNQLVLWTPRGGDGLSCYCPTGNIETYGLELAHNMKWQRLNLALAATWQKSKEVGNGLGYNYNWAQGGESFVPEWVVSARVDYLFPGDKLNVFGEYRYTDQEILRGTDSGDADAIDVRDSYSIVDLGVKYKFDKKWRLSAGVNDVFDKGKEVFITTGMFYGPKTASFYPLAGRMYYTTLEYSF